MPARGEPRADVAAATAVAARALRALSGVHPLTPHCAPQLKILVDGENFQEKQIELPSTLAKRVGPPAVTLEEYIVSARRAAKRKRKHTDLKRSGVLEARRQAAEAAARHAAEAEKAKTPLHPPPPWAVGMEREGRAVRADGILDVGGALASDHDASLFRLALTVHSAQSATLRWWFPPANPGSSNAWVGLFRADTVQWGENGSPCGMVGSGTDKRLYKMITRNEVSGSLSFGSLAKGLNDDLYVFTLQADYGRICRATSERFRVSGGRIVDVLEGGLSSDWPPVGGRKARQAGAAIKGIRRSADKESEVLDERCYFPLTAVDVVLPEKYQDGTHLLKRVYHVVDKLSYLDWGLTSDYDVGGARADDQMEDEPGAANAGGDGGDGRRHSNRMVDKPSAAAPPSMIMNNTQYSSTLASFAQYAARRSIDDRKSKGMSSGTAGSEGYGEATTGSAHRIGLLLSHLRSLVLEELHDTHWGLMWDLGPHSTFLDIGSGYGKVVLHLKLVFRMRTAVGMECVASRDAIAKQALFALEAEAGAAEPAAGAAEPAHGAAPSSAPVLPEPVGAGADGECEGSSSGESTVSAAPAAAEEPPFGPPPPMTRLGPFDGVQFELADATTYDKLTYTHIYIFDWVFSQNTLRDLAQVLQRSPFYILCSFRKVTEWWGHGLVKIQPVAKLQGFKTTGGEGMTCYVYINLEKVPEL